MAGSASDGRRRRPLLDVTSKIARRLDFQTVAQSIVDALIAVTDFKVATLTVREGTRCRRLATAGLPEGRIGMTTPFEHWSVLLVPSYRRGELSYLIPPEAPAQWADIPDLPASDDPDAWTAEHGLVVTLLDHSDELIGFIAVDEPRSGRLPDDMTIDTLEVFARQAQVAFANAHLFAQAQRRAQTMGKLFDIAKAMASTTDFEQVAPRIATAICEQMDVFEVNLARFSGDAIAFHRSHCDHPDQLVTGRIPLTEAHQLIAREVIRDGFLLVGDIADRPDLAAMIDPATRAFMAVGSRDGDRLDVTLAVNSKRVGAFSAADQAFLRGLLDITVVALRNADLYDEVRRTAERDALTGLRNRRGFWVALQEALDRHVDEPVALVIVDVDDFKQVNDTRGHDTGDRALVHVAARLEQGVRETDAVFRIGGEEFVIVMPGTTGDEARRVLGRIGEAIKRTRLDLPLLTISAGVAVASPDLADGDQLFSAADAALYRAKAAGKDRIQVTGASTSLPR